MRGRAGSRLHGHGDDVVDQQRDRGDLRDLRAEVLARDDIRAAGLRVDHDDLAVQRGHDEQHGEHDEGQRQQDVESGQPERGQQEDQHLFRAVRRGRDAVARQHAQRGLLRQPLLVQLRGDERLAEDGALDAVAEPLGDVDRTARRSPVAVRAALGQPAARRQRQAASHDRECELRTPPVDRTASARRVARGAHGSFTHPSRRILLVEREIELQHVHPRFAEEAEVASVGELLHQRGDLRDGRRRGPWRPPLSCNRA